MEERKKLGALGAIGLVLLFVVLLLACWLSAGLPDLTAGLGPWGVYAPDSGSLYLTEAYLETDLSDLLITDRRAAPKDGQLVTYRMDDRRVVDKYDDLLGRPVLAGEAQVKAEPVVHILRDVQPYLRLMNRFRWYLWGFTAGLAAMLIVLRVTANARWKKRQQKLMMKNFKTYGEKYAQEDEELDY